MISPKQALAILMSFLLIAVSIPVPASAQQSTSTPAAPEEYAPVSADDLDALVAPIALYPDALVAQILGAATFPYEIVDAVVWLKQNSSLTGEALLKAVDQQDWDPSVKALTQFSSVLDNLAKNLAWTSALGEASATQQQDVMAAIQRMRAKAYAAGNLKSSPEIKVVQETPQTIIIQPANPQIVYVPTYSPTVVYGAPVVVPGYTSSDVAAAAIISFGVGIAVGAAIYGGCCGWGWSYWGTNWHSHTVIYNRNIYVGNPYWRGGYYGGYRPGYPGYRPGYPGYPGYRPGYPGYGRPPSYYPPGSRPPSTRPPATTLPAPVPTPNPGNRPGNGNPGNRPGNGNPSNPGNRPGNGNPGNRPGNGNPSIQPVPDNRPGNGNPGTRPGNPSTLPANPGNRPGGGNPGNGNPNTRPANPGTRPNQPPSSGPSTMPVTRPSNNENRGYQRPATSTPSAPAARPNALSGSAGGRAQSARGNQSLSGGGGGGAKRGGGSPR